MCLAIAFLFLGWCWLRFITRLPERTVHDVYPFFRRIESDVLYGSFHPAPEENFKSTHSREEFKKWQWKRIHLAMHLCRDITCNCRLLMGWASYERRVNWLAFGDEIRKGLRELQVSCMHSRTASLSIRFRLRLWLIRMKLFSFLPVPSFRNISSHSDTLFRFYNTVEVLAEAMSLVYGEPTHENLLTVLGMVDVEWEESEN